MLLWLPQVFKSSAYFTYVQKGLWALISEFSVADSDPPSTADHSSFAVYQTGLAIYSGDQILQSIQKLAGTALGLVLGMLVWHAGAGTGRGSKEGLGVLVAVFMLPVLAFRLYAPVAVAQFAILSAVTTVLIVSSLLKRRIVDIDSNFPLKDRLLMARPVQRLSFPRTSTSS